MKFTIFGLTISSAWGNGHATPYRGLLRALHHRGHRIDFFEKDVPYYARHRDFSTCDFCNLVLYSNWDEVRNRALRAAEECDVLIVASYCPEGARISDEILELNSPLRIFYDLDTPITLQHLASGIEYLRADQIPEFDLYLSFTGGKVLQELEQRWGARCVHPLYGSVDPEAHRRTQPLPEFACDLSYMGTHSSDRCAKLEALFLEPALRSPKKDFVLAGALYPWDCTWPPNVRRFDHVFPQHHAALYSSSRCTLNITRQAMAQNGYCPSGRFFEAAACGTPILTDSWVGLDSFFTPGVELLVVQNADDVLSALACTDNELLRIAARARERTLAEHTSETRATELLSYITHCSVVSSRPASQAVCTVEQAS